MTPKQLRRLLESSDFSQRGAARDLGINERTMRGYVAGDQPIPRVIELALRQLREKSGKHTVGVNELTESELETFGAAMELARGATWSRRKFIHCEPIRDGAGRFCELRVFDDDESRSLLAIVPIDELGKPEPGKVIS